MWRPNWGCSTSSSTSTTRHEADCHHPRAIAAGIGPEIIAKAFRDSPQVTAGCFVAGDVAAMRRAVQAVTGPGQVPVPVAQIEDATDGAWPAPTLLSGCCRPARRRDLPPWGAGQRDGRASGGRMRGVGRTRGLARRCGGTGHSARAQGGPGRCRRVRFPGHTELLQAEAAAYLRLPLSQVPVRMMLANDELRTVLVSIHVSLRDAIDAVTFDNVLQTLRLPTRRLVPGAGPLAAHGRGRTEPPCGRGRPVWPRRAGRDHSRGAMPPRAQGLDVNGPFRARHGLHAGAPG
jgi:4-hydroxythreonine-4-phosphate dehydrogenase